MASNRQVEMSGVLDHRLASRSPDAGLTLGQRLQRWPNVRPALHQRAFYAGPEITTHTGGLFSHHV